MHPPDTQPCQDGLGRVHQQREVGEDDPLRGGQACDEVAQAERCRGAGLLRASRVEEQHGEQPGSRLAPLRRGGRTGQDQELAHRVPDQGGALQPREQPFQLVRGAEEASPAGQDLLVGSGGRQRRRGPFELVEIVVEGERLRVVPEDLQRPALAVHDHEIALVQDLLGMAQVEAADHLVAPLRPLLLLPLGPPVEQHLGARGGVRPGSLHDDGRLRQLEGHQPHVAEDSASRRDDAGGVANPGNVLGADGGRHEDAAVQLRGLPPGRVEEREPRGPSWRRHGRGHDPLVGSQARHRIDVGGGEAALHDVQILVPPGRRSIGTGSQVVVGPERAREPLGVQLRAPGPGGIAVRAILEEHAAPGREGQADDALAVPEHEEADRARRRGEVRGLDRVALDAPRGLEPRLPLDASRQAGHRHGGAERRAALGQRPGEARRLVLPPEEIARRGFDPAVALPDLAPTRRLREREQQRLVEPALPPSLARWRNRGDQRGQAPALQLGPESLGEGALSARRRSDPGRRRARSRRSRAPRRGRARWRPGSCAGWRQSASGAGTTPQRAKKPAHADATSARVPSG